MPEITLSGPALLALKRMLHDAGHEAPDEIPDFEDLDLPDIETYPHEVAEEEALKYILDACPVCGDDECTRGTSYLGAQMIHRDQHPEARAARARERRHSRRRW